MESESDYGEEIQSPDEDEGESKPSADEAMEANNAEDEEERSADGMDEDTSPAAFAEQTAQHDNPVEDDRLQSSPSGAHSNISDDDEADMEADTPERIESAEPTGEALPFDVGEANADDGNDEDSNSDKGDDDKESSYHSSPPESPSPPRSPDDMYDKGGAAVGENLNHVNSSSNRSPKQQPLEDQDGELDFEEELPERKEDFESSENHLKTDEKAEETKQEEDEEEEEEEEEEEDDDEEEEEGEEKKQVEKPDDADDDDGEVEDDDDLEEGEVKDGSAVRKVLQRPICRFFIKGQCTWGTNCRFLHPGVNDKGNYNMFAPPKPLVPSNGPGMIGPGFGWHGGGPRISPPFHARGFIEPIPPPPPAFEEPAFESAWERGLRHAKEILKKSSKRKEMEPDFEEKRMNLSLGSGDVSNEYEKENDYYNRSPYRSSADPYDPYGYDEPALDPYERQAHDYWRGGNYENFEVRYTRTDYDYRDHERMRERERIDRARERDREREHIFRERERERERDPRSRRDKFERPQHSPERNWRDERYIDPQVPTRARGDEWRDPWRRSTSPKRRNLSRSFSSHSSASYSSSRSSGSGSSSYSSRSRSSSESSHSSYSSRSYTHSRSSHSKIAKQKSFGPGTGQGPMGANLGVAVRRAKPQQPGRHSPVPGKVPRPALEKRVVAAAPVPPAIAPVVVPQPVIERKKTVEKSAPPKVAPRLRSLSSSGSESISSRSRSRVEKPFGAWPQRKNRKSSRSRSSRSRSSSISSLESVSSKSSLSSKSSADSELEVLARGGPSKKDDKQRKEKAKMRVVDPNWKSSFERIKLSKVDSQAALKSMVNTPRTSKDPLKQSGQKTQIKLTLLNKDKGAAPQAASALRKDAGGEARKLKPSPTQEKEASKQMKMVPPPAVAGKKRPLQPSPKPEQPADTTSSAQKASSSTSASSRSASATQSTASTSATTSSRNSSTTQSMATTSGASRSTFATPPAASSSSRSSSTTAAASSSQSVASLSAAAAQLKRSTSSRREELLKQLKAVEDAIARKRAKLA